MLSWSSNRTAVDWAKKWEHAEVVELLESYMGVVIMYSVCFNRTQDWLTYSLKLIF